MRISDWSSDVCSSDLAEARAAAKRDQEQKQRADITALAEQDDGVLSHDVKLEAIEAKVPDSGADDRRITVTCSIVAFRDTAPRTEERRGWKGCASTCRSRWSQYHETTKRTKRQ